jgi:hypothetical protein
MTKSQLSSMVGQLEKFVRQVQSTRARSLSDAELDALMKEVFVA